MAVSGALEHIVIVGGGSAGWITASILGKALDAFPCEITVVESASTPPIGVGEATVPTIIKLLTRLGIDEATFMRR